MSPFEGVLHRLLSPSRRTREETPARPAASPLPPSRHELAPSPLKGLLAPYRCEPTTWGADVPAPPMPPTWQVLDPPPPPRPVAVESFCLGDLGL